MNTNDLKKLHDLIDQMEGLNRSLLPFVPEEKLEEALHLINDFSLEIKPLDDHTK